MNDKDRKEPKNGPTQNRVSRGVQSQRIQTRSRNRRPGEGRSFRREGAAPPPPSSVTSESVRSRADPRRRARAPRGQVTVGGWAVSRLERNSEALCLLFVVFLNDVSIINIKWQMVHMARSQRLMVAQLHFRQQRCFKLGATTHLTNSRCSRAASKGKRVFGRRGAASRWSRTSSLWTKTERRLCGESLAFAI